MNFFFGGQLLSFEHKFQTSWRSVHKCVCRNCKCECAHLWLVHMNLCTDLHEIWKLCSQDSNWPPNKSSCFYLAEPFNQIGFHIRINLVLTYYSLSVTCYMPLTICYLLCYLISDAFSQKVAITCKNLFLFALCCSSHNICIQKDIRSKIYGEPKIFGYSWKFSLCLCRGTDWIRHVV